MPAVTTISNDAAIFKKHIFSWKEKWSKHIARKGQKYFVQLRSVDDLTLFWRPWACQVIVGCHVGSSILDIIMKYYPHHYSPLGTLLHDHHHLLCYHCRPHYRCCPQQSQQGKLDYALQKLIPDWVSSWNFHDLDHLILDENWFNEMSIISLSCWLWSLSWN